jgi:hypothetical protein
MGVLGTLAAVGMAVGYVHSSFEPSDHRESGISPVYGQTASMTMSAPVNTYPAEAARGTACFLAAEELLDYGRQPRFGGIDGL